MLRAHLDGRRSIVADSFVHVMRAIVERLDATPAIVRHAQIVPLSEPCAGEHNQQQRVYLSTHMVLFSAALKLWKLY
jgi:hypothetical protein